MGSLLDPGGKGRLCFTGMGNVHGAWLVLNPDFSDYTAHTLSDVYTLYLFKKNI